MFSLMLKWCSYCQQFKGETSPYDDLSVTYGLCQRCEAQHPDIFASEVVRHSEFLRHVYHSLYEAGRRNDLPSAQQLVKDALAAKFRPVDILLGILTPLLYKIGEQWRSGTITVTDEHEFTAFSERIVDLIEVSMQRGKTRHRRGLPRYFLMNAPGNTHTLAIRILSFWLKDRSVCAPTVINHIDLQKLAEHILEAAPKLLLLSMALPQQLDSVVSISALVGELPADAHPKVFVGGYAVKSGLVTFVPGAELVADINLLGTSD
ncbi:cobalamin B12-binding domain-containing protein [Bradyrhizobium daqingense]|nr:B12-binding domain-containing protein [Bradyrhizobium daqingense]UFS88278.1 cobalamin B12-binding domain-containing protein [Bradyrhizobium daqingense]